MKYINSKNLFDYAFVNEDTLVRPLRGICVCFHGYTDATMFEKSNEMATVLGKAGIAWVFPYYSVWAWLSRSSQEFNEQVIDAVYDRLGADEKTPLIISGGSMGGLTALNYMVYGKRKAVGCAVNCPVTDMNVVFSDKQTYRRAILSAHIDEDGELEQILKKYSPVQFAQELPKIPYFLLFGEEDPYIVERHMYPILEKFKLFGIEHTLLVQKGMKHCDIDSHPQALSEFCNFIISLV